MHLLAAKADTTKPAKVEVVKELKDHTVKELVKIYNEVATKLSESTLTAFRSKAIAISRVEAIRKELERVEKVKTKVAKEAKKASKTKTAKVVEPTPKTDDKPKSKGRTSTKRFTFGSKVSAEEVENMIKDTFGSMFKISKVEFVGSHYWHCDLKLKGSKLVAKKVRVDYLVNYLRIPRVFKESRKAILEQAQTACT